MNIRSVIENNKSGIASLKTRKKGKPKEKKRTNFPRIYVLQGRSCSLNFYVSGHEFMAVIPAIISLHLMVTLIPRHILYINVTPASNFTREMRAL